MAIAMGNGLGLKIYFHMGICPLLQLMEEILHQLRLVVYPHYLQGFIRPRWCRISSINCMLVYPQRINFVRINMPLLVGSTSLPFRTGGWRLFLFVAAAKAAKHPKHDVLPPRKTNGWNLTNTTEWKRRNIYKPC